MGMFAAMQQIRLAKTLEEQLLNGSIKHLSLS
jgi:hypothetical protein